MSTESNRRWTRIDKRTKEGDALARAYVAEQCDLRTVMANASTPRKMAATLRTFLVLGRIDIALMICEAIATEREPR